MSAYLLNNAKFVDKAQIRHMCCQQTVSSRNIFSHFKKYLHVVYSRNVEHGDGTGGDRQSPL